ncbi:phage holin family protein, partial [Patescibacteria group bacterium]|nr:phage holin family protein [Patescibacteria group bacterium]
KPLLVILTLPINIISLGLFTLVINAGLVMLMAAIVTGFAVVNFWWAFLFGVVLAVVTWFLSKIFK